MASIISTKTAGGGGISVTGDTSGVLQLASNNGTTAVTVDASQNVGIGTASPRDVSGYTTLAVNDTTGAIVDYMAAGTRIASIGADSGGLDIRAISSMPAVFSTNNTERMRIDSSGNVLVGTTSALATNQHNFQSSSTTSAAVMTLRNAGATAGLFWQVGPDSNSSFKVYNASNTGMFMSNGSTSWSSSSDETLKTDLKPIENGINKVNSLRSVTGRFKTDEETVSRSFLIAQDVQAVLPEAVSETPDGYLGVAYTDVIPLLVASIKELKAIVDTQAERIAVLESKIV